MREILNKVVGAVVGLLLFGVICGLGIVMYRLFREIDQAWKSAADTQRATLHH